MKVLVNGLGNIGSTLIELLVHHKELLEIDEIYAIKNIPKSWEKARYVSLEKKGITLLTPEHLEKIGQEISFLFDATSNGGAIKRKGLYSSFPRLLGAVAQGSEEGFGMPYMAGINDKLVAEKSFFTVVSCNTHGILSVLNHFSGGDLERVEEADFVIVRRSEDIGNHERLVSANVVARHRSEEGTHHAADATRLLETMDISAKLFSSDITTPAQLMHGLRFNILLKDTRQNTQKSSFVGLTEYYDSNRLFEIGRRESFQGRLYHHSILVSNNIYQKQNRIIGWAFIPQEGNTILSTIKLFLLRTQPDKGKEIFRTIKDELLSVIL